MLTPPAIPSRLYYTGVKSYTFQPVLKVHLAPHFFGLPKGDSREGGSYFLSSKLRESSLVRLGRECRDREDLTEGRKSLLIVFFLPFTPYMGVNGTQTCASGLQNTVYSPNVGESDLAAFPVDNAWFIRGKRFQSDFSKSP